MAHRRDNSAVVVESTAADKWLVSLHKSVRHALASFSREATQALMKILRSGSFSPDQARPGNLCAFLMIVGRNTKGQRLCSVLTLDVTVCLH